ncbi:MAG TPA: hypothetical protein VFT99_03660, partial [Roseiflexaceae bacterium]|nr:hypothetical protein [Roseiflexaceae bacterium]
GMHNLWFSSDSGAQWQRANGEAPGVITFTHATPPVVVGVYQGTMRVLELPQPAGQRCFVETGFCISGRIREYWQQNGGLPVFGYPIGPQMPLAVEGRTVTGQWFERNRLELHPENSKPYDVLLGRLGADALETRKIDWRSYPQADPKSAHYFAATGQAIAPEFWKYWSSHGLEFDGRRGTSFNESLALFGMPLSPPIMETSRTDGGTYLTQYFERARFEYHPENAGTPYVVLLGLLGSEQHGS